MTALAQNISWFQNSTEPVSQQRAERSESTNQTVILIFPSSTPADALSRMRSRMATPTDFDAAEFSALESAAARPISAIQGRILPSR
jgi:hypothetical protein